MGTARTKQKNDYNNANYRHVGVNVAKWEYTIWKDHADKNGEPMATFIKRAVRRQIEEDKKDATD